ncbi:MAG: hypothetical protein ABIG56_01205 [Candidatus Omnitrophota bacterium]
MSRKKENNVAERRKYIRLDTVFPVMFRLLSLDEKEILSEGLQGFTNSVSKGGICLVVNNLTEDLSRFITDRKAKLSIGIELPIAGSVIPALAAVTWFHAAADNPKKYFIGLSYEQINPVQNSMIMRYARGKKLFIPVTISIIIVLGLALGVNSIISLKLIKGNKALVNQLVVIVQESSIAKQRVKEINREGEELRLKIETLQSQIETVEAEKSNLSKEVDVEIPGIENKLEKVTGLLEELTRDKSSLQEQLISLQYREGAITEELLRLDKKKAALEKANIDKMYQWLRVHQNPRTGLVMSFEGDNNLKEMAFIYDQSLAMQAFNYFADFERASKVLDFFQNKADRGRGLFLNAYYANDGKVAEYAVNSGPNIWLGIGAIQYTSKAKDTRYLAFAEEIAERIMDLQSEDKDGGIPGGPGLEWYSTEHNLDAYAFFKMLYKTTGKERYLEASEKVLNWLSLHTYDNKDVPVKRGKGDSTIATDTYAWSLASLGPEKLNHLGMNPERIIEFAEQNCAVETSFLRPEGKTIQVKGFDFAPQRNLSRGGVVSSEWTAQMVIAFKIMAKDYYQKGLKAKAHSYEMKADEYMSELSNMIISSPSPSGQGESCLPYATQDSVDTGHGWKTPEGKSTGSVAATAYTIFAYYNYNPLELTE